MMRKKWLIIDLNSFKIEVKMFSPAHYRVDQRKTDLRAAKALSRSVFARFGRVFGVVQTPGTCPDTEPNLLFVFYPSNL